MATSSPGLGFRTSAIKKMTGGWFTAIAILFIVLGIVAIAEPWTAGLAAAMLVGWLLVIAGAVHLVAALRAGSTGGTIWQALIGLVYVAGGVYFLMNPLLALGTLTLFLAVILLVEAVIEFFTYLRERGVEGSSWLLMNSLVTLFLGALIWIHWPSSAVWAIGTLIGVNLLMRGISRLMIRQAARRLAA